MFFPADEALQIPIDRNLGSYLQYDPKTSFMEQISESKGKPLYVAGALGLTELMQLKKCKVSYIESNKPASDALLG